MGIARPGSEAGGRTLNISSAALDIRPMETMRTDARAQAGFWTRVGAALAALARMTGCSVEQSPLPELREVAHDLRDWR